GVEVRDARLLQLMDRAVAVPLQRVDAGVDDEPRGAVRLRVEHPEALERILEQPHLVGEAFAVEPPTLDERTPAEDASETAERRAVPELLLDRELEVMAGVR